MDLKYSLARIAGRTSQVALERLGRGSTAPGRIAMTLDPDILGDLTAGYEIIIVTGTNGKTLTTALTVGILQQSGANVITNPSGANMISGIVSTFLKAPKTSAGRNFAVLEIDEGSLPRIASYLEPSVFVFTNIFRDQLDRYGEIYTTYDFLVRAAESRPNAPVILNGDCPIFNSRPLPNALKYFGFDQEWHEPKRAHYNTEGVLCPKCENILEYTLNTYANLGRYQCPKCDFRRPDLSSRVEQLGVVTNTTSEFVVDGTNYRINIGGLYNIYNALAAAAIAEHFEIPPAVIDAGFAKSRAVFGRQESVNIDGKQVAIVLIKNPAGANQSLELLKLAPYPFTLVTLLNANFADGIDTSWIWDANFEAVAELDVDKILVGGVRHEEMARRYRVAGFEDKIEEFAALPEVIAAIKHADREHIYVLTTYTAMLQLRELLARDGFVAREMR